MLSPTRDLEKHTFKPQGGALSHIPVIKTILTKHAIWDAETACM